MMQKAWGSIEEVPYCFLMSSVKFQGYMRQKVTNFDPNWAFPDCNSDGFDMMHKAWWSVEVAPQFSRGHPSNLKITRAEKSMIIIQFEY